MTETAVLTLADFLLAREKLAGLVSDWQANGNSRELGDPRADVWQKCATQLLDALKPLDAR